MRDLSEEDPAELRATKANLNFISLAGNIGCLVNGRRPGHVHDGHHQSCTAATRPTSST